MSTYAILNVSGERTTGTAPHYGVIVSTFFDRLDAYRALDAMIDRGEATYDRHTWRVGLVGAAAGVGSRLRYTEVPDTRGWEGTL